MSTPIVEIDQSGRGGTIMYIEGENRVRFDWEFAMPPTLVLMWGPGSSHWDVNYPWAAGRQAEIFEFVGNEVVRQQAPDHSFKFDLASGNMDIVRPTAKRSSRSSRSSGGGETASGRGKRELGAPAESTSTTDRTSAPVGKRSAAYERFMASVVPVWEQWPDGKTYDAKAIAKMTPEEREEVVELLTARDPTWREVEALAVIDLPKARAGVDAASNHHLSIDARLAGAEVMHSQGRLPELEEKLALQIRRINRVADGLDRALRLAEQHPSETIRQALLWASYNATECAPRFAALLMTIVGVSTPPFDEQTQAMLRSLDVHNSSFTRDAAFKELCARVGMVLDHDVAY